MPVGHMAFPPAAAEALTRLDRQSQLHASAFLTSAARHLARHPFTALTGCSREGMCPPPRVAPPRRSGASPATALCALCALDAAVFRHSHGYTESVQREFWAVGTVAKQAYITTWEANPGLPRDPSGPEAVCLMLSSRLHLANLEPQTVAELEDEADRLSCLRAVERTGDRGRVISDPPEAVMASLLRRGWVVNGHLTNTGLFAVEANRRTVREQRRTARTTVGRPG